MKALAILRDSFREALDSKVLYGMLILSGILILFVASVSYRPLPAQEAFETITHQFVAVWGNHNQSLRLRPFYMPFEVKDLQQLNQAADPSQGDYRFRLQTPRGTGGRGTTGQSDTLHEATAFWLSSEDETVDPAKVTPAQMEEFLRNQMELYGNVQVRSLKMVEGGPAHYTFEVETRGSSGVRGWPHEPSLFFGAVPLKFLHSSLGSQVFLIENTIVNGLGAWVALLVGVIITSFFIPNMLNKGAVDLLLVKPINRPTLLIFKYLGGLSFVLVLTAFTVLGMWAAIGMRSGIWNVGFLVLIPAITFFFAILYAVSALMGVLTRSPIVCILVTIAFWFFMWVVGTAHAALEQLHKDPSMGKEIPDWVYTSVNTVHAVLPRTKDLDSLTTRSVSRGVLTEPELRANKLDKIDYPPWGEVLGVSGAYIAVLLGLACWRFTTRDY